MIKFNNFRFEPVEALTLTSLTLIITNKTPDPDFNSIYPFFCIKNPDPTTRTESVMVLSEITQRTIQG